MPGRLVTHGAVCLIPLLLSAGIAAAQDQAADLLRCRAKTDAAMRLECYDALASRASATVHRGAGSGIIPQFELGGPTRLVFESSDAIMVVYLLDETGAVIQNLHQAGAGSGSFMIDKPGRYSIQVNASGGWLVRLENPE